MTITKIPKSSENNISNQDIQKIDIKQEQIEKQEIKEFERILDRKKSYIKHPNLKYAYMGDNFFSISTKGNGEIDILYKDGSPYFNVVEVRKDMEKLGVYERILKLAGYKEEIKNGIHIMINLKTKEELDPYSKEYFKSWQEIMFYETYRFINHGSDKELRKLYDSDAFIGYGLRDFHCLRFKHSFKFDKEILNKGKELSEYYKKTIISIYFENKTITPEIIKGWITDERFKKVGDEPTREEYREYLKQGYIDEKLYKECMELFDLKDKKEQKKINIERETNFNIEKINY